LINAQEARKMTEENHYLYPFWQEVDKRICEAASAGLDMIIYKLDFVLTKDKFVKEIAPKFKKLGFEVAYFPGLNLLKIMW
jgi:hypothetical protein